MGRVIVILLIIAALVLIWKAFGPSSWNRTQPHRPEQPRIKGPDDDEDFLWELEKRQFKERRAREARQAEEEQRRRQEEQRRRKEGGQDPEPENP